MSMGSNPVFPTLLYNYSLSYVINSININKSKKKLVFCVFYTKRVFIFLKLLYKINFLHKFIIVKNKKNNKLFFKIFLSFYKTKPVCSNFKLISTPSKIFTISNKSLNLLTKKTGNSVYLISTSKGLLPHYEVIRLRIGGILVGSFSF